MCMTCDEESSLGRTFAVKSHKKPKELGTSVLEGKESTVLTNIILTGYIDINVSSMCDSNDT